MPDQDITEYDTFKYDYSKFWENRTYEHEAEKIGLLKFLKKMSGAWFIDIGGSYGRHIPLYHKRFHNCVLMDYSMTALKQASKYLKDNNIKNVYLVAGNVYHLPFIDGSFDGGMMIRVIHHLDDPKTAISEISRVLKGLSKFILEFANKVHIKALLKSFLKYDIKFLISTEPYLIPSQGDLEGTQKELPGIIYNYHPRYLRKLAVSQEMYPSKTLSLSYLRVSFLKRVLPLKFLTFCERVLQILIGWANLGPSVLMFLTKKQESIVRETPSRIDQIICCPKCKGELTSTRSSMLCKNCSINYPIEGKIIDLRYPKPKHEKS